MDEYRAQMALQVLGYATAEPNQLDPELVKAASRIMLEYLTAGVSVPKSDSISMTVGEEN